jgi:arylsulfatase A-like enzyme
MDLHLGRIDAALGMLMERAGDDGVVLVISDHGYGDNPGREPIQRGFNEWIQPPHWHTIDGIIAASGGPIRSGGQIPDAKVLDITPTILALLGLPVGEDMAGRVLTEMIDDRFLAEYPVTRIPTYEDGTRGDSDALESAYDGEVLRRLRALGYID